MRTAPTLLAAALALALAPAHAEPPASATATAAAPESDADARATEVREELRRAREELRALTARIAELSARSGVDAGARAFAFRYLVDPDRALVGVVLGADADAVRLDAVTPGGPAEKAGLKAGDVLVRINGKPVPKPGEARATGAAIRGGRGAAVEAARRLIGELREGDAVHFEVLRDGKPLTVTAKAERRESWGWPMLAAELGDPAAIYAFGIDERALRRAIDDRRRAAAAAIESASARRALADAAREVRRSIIMLRGSGLGELKLHSLDAELGRYFGASEGVLVLSASERMLPELKTGDVILSVAGERTEDPRDVMRALGRQQPGAAINVEVLRDRKRELVVSTIEGDFGFDWWMAPEPPTPPAPPPAPVTPAPPPPGRGTML